MMLAAVVGMPGKFEVSDLSVRKRGMEVFDTHE